MNLLSFIFGHIYFPTHSNSLKELATYSGACWESGLTSGIQTIPLRYQWEKEHDCTIKERLLAYNRDDCKALSVLACETQNLTTNLPPRADLETGAATRISAPPRIVEIRDTFNALLRSAYSDYSKSKINLAALKAEGSAPKIEQPKLQPSKRKLPAVKGRIVHVGRKRKCERHPDHPSMLVPTKKAVERVLVDLAFTSTGCRKTLLRYVGPRGRCLHCGQMYVPPAFKQIKSQVYGPGFVIWVVYLRTVLRLSYRLITQATRDLFGIDVSRWSGSFIRRCAEDHAKTEEGLWGKILASPAIHVDETKISILGDQQYVWVVTDGKHVVFRLTEGRETAFLRPLLSTYEGTLVSDFYGGYDALPCRQQKCLVHLIRDLNEDLWKNPFDVELELFISSVRDLLLPMLADVQRFGFKARHLRKHQKGINTFYRDSIDANSSTHELVGKYQKRFRRYRDSLFTFVERDGVPWNNNAAERALRHLAVQRKISGAFSSEGAQDYIRLLGIAQSCRFQEKSFLGFLRADSTDVDAFTEGRPRRGRRG